jgi:predicted DNA-binding protein (UPF0251 family)
MNTLKTVYSKLFKEETTNLASHEVELAVFDEIKAARTEVETRVQTSIDEIKAFEIKFKDLKKKMDVNAAYVEKIYTENRKKFQDASDKAKALGLELPKQWFDELEALRKVSNKIPQSNLGNVFPI